MHRSKGIRLLTLIVLVAGRSAVADGFVLEEPVPGFRGAFLPGTWIPLSTTLRAGEEAFAGEVTVAVRGAHGTRYEVLRRVELEAAGAAPLDVVMPASAPTLDVEVRATRDDGEVRTWRGSFSAAEQTRRIILVVGRPGSMDLLYRIRGTMATEARMIYVTPEELPAHPLGFDAVDTIVLHDARLNRIGPAAVAGLDIWVRRGGRLITIGGVHFSETDVSALRSLLPGHVDGLGRGLPAEWNELFPLGIVGAGSSILYSPLYPQARTQQVPRRGVPLIAYQDRGKGSVQFVATNVATLGRIAMPGSGIWREAFPPLSAAGRVRVPTVLARNAPDGLVGETLLSSGPALFPSRGTVAVVGLLYIVFVALITRWLARSRHPPRRTVTRPAALAALACAAMLIGAARGTWTRPASIVEGELFRGTALHHGTNPSPGVVEKDLIAASRTGGPLEIGLPASLQPVPLSGRTVSVRQGPEGSHLPVVLERSEHRYFFLQSSPALDVTAELAASARGIRLSLRNRSGRRLSDPVVLWNGRMFALSAADHGETLGARLGPAIDERTLRRSFGRERARMVLRIREAVTPGTPVLVAFTERALVPVSVPPTHGRRSVSVALLSLEQAVLRGIGGRP